MTGDNQDIAVAASLARIEGQINTLTAKMDAGDKHSAQLVELIKERVETVTRAVGDIKDALAEQRAHADAAASAVRVDVERQLTEHADGQARPHKDLEADVEALKTFRTQAKVVITLLVIFGGPAIGAVYQRLLGN